MKKVLAILLTLAMALSLSVTAFAADIVIPASGSELTDSNNSYEEDLTVTYSYTAPDTTAEKVFNVTVAFTLPTDMALTYTDTQNVYTWDHTLGKYVLDDENSTEAAGELTDEGEFTITVTNRSNVPVEFDVAYTANTAAVFASEVTDWANNADVKLDTVADGQEIGTDGITITDVTVATAANTTFASADCTGKLSVTGINSGKTPGASGTDKLGTFTVTIAEGAANSNALPAITDPAAFIESLNLPVGYANAIGGMFYMDGDDVMYYSTGEAANFAKTSELIPCDGYYMAVTVNGTLSKTLKIYVKNGVPYKLGYQSFETDESAPNGLGTATDVTKYAMLPGTSISTLIANTTMPEGFNSDSKWQSTTGPANPNDTGMYVDGDNLVFAGYSRLSVNTEFVSIGDGVYFCEEVTESGEYKFVYQYTIYTEDGKMVGFDLDFVSNVGGGSESHAKYRPEV